MRRNKNILKKAAAVVMMSTMTVASVTTNAWAYGEMSVDDSTFKADTESSTDFQNWRTNVWQGGEKQFSDSAKIALTPGADAADLNFAWYSETAAKPAVMVWKDGQKSSAKIVEGTASAISAQNWQGKSYTASNKVSVNDYFEAGTSYGYQYTENYTGETTTWSAEYTYKTAASRQNFSVILTGDPQVGASGSSDDFSANDSSVARDAYNWNKTMTQALKTSPNAAFLLSAGDQINNSNADTSDDNKTRESEYAGYLYPSVFRSLPIAATIGNHDTAGVDYTNHFNNPNAGKKLGATAAGSDYYFSYGDVLFISLNTNNRNQSEHRALLNDAIASNKSAKWKVVVFHSDIYGSGQPHADTDAATNRVIFAPLMDEFNIDICLTGHDHTFSRSYQVEDGNVINYDLSSGSVTDPEGTLYITTGSGSGSKYYDLLNYTPYYIAERTNKDLPSFSTIDFTNGSLTLKTYDYNGNKYANDFTIKKTDTAVSVDEAIANAEAKLADASSYTEESVASLKNSLTALKTMKAANTTVADPLIDKMSKAFGTDSDFIKGYGSVKNAEDKDMGTANRLKKGMSTLLDKTIYTQISNGELIAGAKYPIVSSTVLENAKTAVVKSTASLSVKSAEPATDPTKKPAETPTTNGTETPTQAVTPSASADADQATVGTQVVDSKDASKTNPKTGDRMPVTILGFGMAMIASLAAGSFVIFKKKEKKCVK